MSGVRIFATNYIEIYMVFDHDRKIGRKYAILGRIVQPVG